MQHRKLREQRDFGMAEQLHPIGEAWIAREPSKLLQKPAKKRCTSNLTPPYEKRAAAENAIEGGATSVTNSLTVQY